MGTGLGQARARYRLLAIVTALLVLATTVGGVGIADAAGPPAITVTPSTGLRDLQSVQVDGTGFTARVSVVLFECQAGVPVPNGCDFATLNFVAADGSGAVHAAVTVRRLIGLGKRKVDCAVAGACVLHAEGQAEGETVDTPISFDPAIPPVVPKITITPATALTDHQLVRIDGTGFTPGTSALLLECAAKKALRRLGTCAYSSHRSAVVAADGTFVARRVAVSRMLQTVLDDGDVSNLDCASKAGACVVTVESEDLDGATTTGPLGFDPAVPAVVPSASVSPPSGLADHQMVTIKGQGYTPGANVIVLECATGSDGGQLFFGGCDYANAASVTAGFGGKFRVSLAVQRSIAPATGVTTESSLDCAASTNACVLEVTDLSANAPTELHLAFDSRVPTSNQTLSLPSSRNLSDNQRIGANAAGFTPFSTVTLVECTAAARSGDLSACDSASSQNAVVGADGRVAGSIAVHRIIGGDEGLVDCKKRDGACVVAVVAGGISTGAFSLFDISEFSGQLGPLGSSKTSAPPPSRRAAAGQKLPGFAFAPISFG